MVAAAPALTACGDEPPYELPSGGFPSEYESPGATSSSPYATSTPEDIPSPDTAGTQTAEASPTPARVKPDIAGYELDDLRSITWRSTENPKLADAIRERGKAAEGDPAITGTDPDYYEKAIVLGIPAAKAQQMFR